MRDNQRETRLAYLAGIVDGEGCITMYRNREALNPGYFVVCMKCSMCEPQAVKMLQAEFGGSIGIVRPTRANKHHRNAFMWQLYGRKKVKAALELLLPQLRVKHEIALAVLEFCNTHKFIRNLSREELRRREELFLRVKKLIRPVPATTKSEDPERGCDSLNSPATVREESEAVLPPSIH